MLYVYMFCLCLYMNLSETQSHYLSHDDSIFGKGLTGWLPDRYVIEPVLPLSNTGTVTGEWLVIF